MYSAFPLSFLGERGKRHLKRIYMIGKQGVIEWIDDRCSLCGLIQLEIYLKKQGCEMILEFGSESGLGEFLTWDGRAWVNITPFWDVQAKPLIFWLRARTGDEAMVTLYEN